MADDLRFADILTHLRLCEDLTNTMHNVATALGVTPAVLMETIRATSAKTQIRVFRVGRTVYMRVVVHHPSRAGDQDELRRAERIWATLASEYTLRYEDDPRSVGARRQVTYQSNHNRSLTGNSSSRMLEGS